MNKPVDPFKPAGFTETMFAEPYPVTAHPDSNHFHPTPCMAIGEELNLLFGTKRLIVQYDIDNPPKRKVTEAITHWPNQRLYLSDRDVEGWKQ